MQDLQIVALAVEGYVVFCALCALQNAVSNKMSQAILCCRIMLKLITCIHILCLLTLPLPDATVLTGYGVMCMLVLTTVDVCKKKG